MRSVRRSKLARLPTGYVLDTKPAKNPAPSVAVVRCEVVCHNAPYDTRTDLCRRGIGRSEAAKKPLFVCHKTGDGASAFATTLEQLKAFLTQEPSGNRWFKVNLHVHGQGQDSAGFVATLTTQFRCPDNPTSAAEKPRADQLLRSA